jgi:hypothetical protein
VKNSVVFWAVICLAAGSWQPGVAAVPWATRVISYDYDGDGNPANDNATYSNPAAALGEPSRMTAAWPSGDQVVSMFNPAWRSDQIVKVTGAGQLVVGFDTPIVHDPSHPYGVDLIVFGNSFFNDTAWPSGQMSSPAALWDNPGLISVSADGVDWRVVPGVSAASLFPTQGYLDGGPQDLTPGTVPSDFLKPVNPALSLSAFDGLSYSQALALYDGSGGGAPVDISKAGLSDVRYVKITVPQGASYDVGIDGFAVVPEPMSLVLLACAAVGAMRRRM